jgi:CBS domain-containing protein
MQSYYYLMGLRLRKQAQSMIENKVEAQNIIDIDSLTKIEQATIKEIFKTIANFQDGIRIKFTGNLN